MIAKILVISVAAASQNHNNLLAILTTFTDPGFLPPQISPLTKAKYEL